MSDSRSRYGTRGGKRPAGRLKSVDEDTEDSSSPRPPSRPRGTTSFTGTLTTSHRARVPPDLVRDDDCSTGIVTAASYAVGIETGMLHHSQEAAPGALVKVTVAKGKSKCSSVGIQFADSSNDKIVVCSISQVSLFQGTPLQVGHEIVSINGMPCEGLNADFLNEIVPEIEGDLTIVARRREASASTSTGQATAASLSAAHTQTMDHHFVREEEDRAPEASANMSVGGTNEVDPVTERREESSGLPNQAGGEVIVDEMGSESTTQEQVASNPPPTDPPGGPVCSPGAFAVRGQTAEQRTLGMLSPPPEDITVDGQIPIAAEVASQGDLEARLREMQSRIQTFDEHVQEAVNRAIVQSAVPAQTVTPVVERNVAEERGVGLSEIALSVDDREALLDDDGDALEDNAADEPSPSTTDSNKKLWKRPSFLVVVTFLLVAIVVGTIVGMLSGGRSSDSSSSTNTASPPPTPPTDAFTIRPTTVPPVSTPSPSSASSTAPNNDSCETSMPLSTDGTHAFGSTRGASFDNVGYCDTTNTEPGVWYTVIGTGNPLTATTCFDLLDSNVDLDFDTQISVFSGTCNNLACVAGNDDSSCGLQSTVTWETASGDEYFILVHGFGTTGDFALSVLPTTGPPATSPPPTSDIDLIGCDDAPQDLEECILGEQTNDGLCLDCDPTVPASTDCTELQEWYCGLSTCCDDCENQVADAAECVDTGANLGCSDFQFSALCEGGIGLEQCSEALAAFTDCTVANCPPDADILCALNIVDADSCAEVEASCQFFNACCNDSCGEEIKFILDTCALGVCASIDCGAPAPPTDTPPTVAPGPPPPPAFDGCSEATAALTSCVANSCPPDADVICDPNFVDGDTCADVQGACQEFTTCCNGQCGDEIEGILATCGLGVCAEIDCGGEPAPPTVSPPPTSKVDLETCGLDCCSEAIEAFTECTIANCPPDADLICDLNLVDADNCVEVETSCQFFNSCCNDSCGEEIRGLLATCALGVCYASVDCSAPLAPGATPPAPSPVSETEEFEGCDEAIAAFTSCVASNCPEDADQICDPNLADGDNCQDVQGACQEFTTCCNGQCGDEVEALLSTCALGVCSEVECTR